MKNYNSFEPLKLNKKKTVTGNLIKTDLKKIIIYKQNIEQPKKNFTHRHEQLYLSASFVLFLNTLRCIFCFEFNRRAKKIRESRIKNQKQKYK